ncbi:MAG: alpha/beta hydrolase [Flavobacteriaceae bacterium]|nr:alpha/beta hydrolase [Flavobacteriaceae bacterium]
MKKKHSTLLIILLFISVANSQKLVEKKIIINKHVEGTLLTPKPLLASSLVIFIGGSGPVDRNGNQIFAENDMLKKIASSLTNKGISTFRYDKRVVKQINTKNMDEEILFDDFVEDTKSAINFFRQTYDKIIIAGHSQGSLVGLLALDEKVAGFISMNGAGQTIDEIIKTQITKSAPSLANQTIDVLNKLKKGETTTNYPIALESIFNIKTQPFLISWMKYNPSEIIKKINIPCLIIAGENDLQMDASESIMLDKSAQNSKLILIKKMNHILFKIDGNKLENLKSYNNKNLKVAEEVIEGILDFIGQID